MLLHPNQISTRTFGTLSLLAFIIIPRTSNDGMDIRNFKKTIKFENGRYQVTWPWKGIPPDLQVNRELAKGKLSSPIARMRSKPDFMKHYGAIIQDQLDKEIVEKVNSIFKSGTTHYISHHAVIKILKLTTKLLIVYDASARKRKDLNECL